MHLAYLLIWGATLGVQPSLKFESRTSSHGRVLLAYDCGQYARQQCFPWEEQFTGPQDYTSPKSGNLHYPGDSAVLSDSLTSGRFDEVWLLSGGGEVVAGLGVARELRARGAFVRVPAAKSVVESEGGTSFLNGGICASSCTIAFMGGALRVVDIGAQYILHSPSMFLGTVPDGVIEILRKGGLRQLASAIQFHTCASVFSSARLFQNTLQTPRRLPGTPLRSENPSDAYVKECAEGGEYGSEQEQWDSQVLSLERMLALQDIGMRMERTAARQALSYWLRQQSSFGPQFDDALQMIATMYAAPITAADPLSSAELLALGYVTEFLELGKRER